MYGHRVGFCWNCDSDHVSRIERSTSRRPIRRSQRSAWRRQRHARPPARCDGPGRPQRRIPLRSVNLHRALHGGEKARRRCSSWTKGFAEPVAVSSTQPTDRPLPRRALGLGLDLVALRARRTQEPKRSRCEGQVASCDPRSIRRRRRSFVTSRSSSTCSLRTTHEGNA